MTDIYNKVKNFLETTDFDEDDEFYMDILNGVGYKTKEEAYLAGVLNEGFGFYLSDGLWVYPNGEVIEY